jgi:hypothetical protein
MVSYITIMIPYTCSLLLSSKPTGLAVAKPYHMALSENRAPCSVQWLIIMFLIKIVTWGIHAIFRHSHITSLVLNRNWM